MTTRCVQIGTTLVQGDLIISKWGHEDFTDRHTVTDGPRSYTGKLVPSVRNIAADVAEQDSIQ